MHLTRWIILVQEKKLAQPRKTSDEEFLPGERGLEQRGGVRMGAGWVRRRGRGGQR